VFLQKEQNNKILDLDNRKYEGKDNPNNGSARK